MPGIAAIVLAAGGSTRMGRPKQLLPFEGESLVRRATRTALEAGGDPIIVVLGACAELIRPELEPVKAILVDHPSWVLGIGSSLRAGAKRLLEVDSQPRAVVILLCDQPLVSADSLKRQIAAHEASGIAFSACEGDDRTLSPPVVIAGERVPDLLGLPDDRGAKALWSATPQMVHRFPCPDAAFDVDTSADYARLIGSESESRNISPLTTRTRTE